MPSVRRVISGFMALFRRAQDEQALDDELRMYFDASVADKMHAGMARSDAARAARVEMGSVEAVKDYTRDAGWETRLDALWRDLRYAVRTLRKSPAFTAVAATTLALGIGANTAIFTVVNAIVLRPLPVDRPDELIAFETVYPDGIEPVFSYPAYRRFAADGGALGDVIAASSVRRDPITLDGPPEPVDLKWVSGNYFTTLGVPAAIGRTLIPGDDRRSGGDAVAVLSDAYWTRRFGRDPSSVGRRFRAQTTTFTIVGVAARGFFGETGGEAADIWLPLTRRPGVTADVWNGHGTTWLGILARRRPGVTVDAARAGFQTVYERIRDEVAAGTDSAEFRRSVLQSRLAVSSARAGSSRLRAPLSTPLAILMALVGLVLLVAAANVASLMLARAAARRREVAVCLALGAARFRLVCHGLAEAGVLAAVGGAAGLLLAYWGGSVLVTLVSGALPISFDAAPDRRVLAFTTLISAATAVVFGVLPALHAVRIDPLPALKVAGGPGGAVRLPLRRALVVAQLVMSLVLLVGAGLFVRSLLKLEAIDVGFDPNRVLLLQVAPPAADVLTAESRRNVYRQLLAKAETVAGVRAASGSFSGVFTRGTWGNVIAVEGYVPRPGVTPRTFANAITPRYFDVMRIPVIRGRAFTDEDRETMPRVAVVNRTFARQFFGGADVIGRRVGLCTTEPCAAPANGWMTIVGVAEDAKYVDLRERSRSMLYVPQAQSSQALHEIEIRTSADPAAVAATLHRELSGVDHRLAIVGMTELRDQVDASIVPERLVARLSATFGLLALALAAVGLYGVIAYVTAERTGEIGIRMALGADGGDIRRLVLRDTLTLVVVGVAIGTPIALAGAQLIARQLYGVGPSDPLAMSIGLATLTAAAIVAGYLPARRAARVDPVVALRAE
jgi:predicted permease